MARRRGILDAASRLFLRHGFAGTTMQMIAQEAEFSVGYLYRHFPGKEALLDAIIGRQVEIFEDARDRNRRAQSGRPLDILRQNLLQISRQLKEQAHLGWLILVSEEVRPDRIKPLSLRFQREDAETFRQAMANGDIRACDPDLVAAVFSGVAIGVIRLLLETGRIDRIEEMPAIVEELVLEPLTGRDPEVVRKEMDGS